MNLSLRIIGAVIFSWAIIIMLLSTLIVTIVRYILTGIWGLNPIR